MLLIPFSPSLRASQNVPYTKLDKENANGYITHKKGDTIRYDECLHELLDVYEFRIAVINEHVNSMTVKTEADEIECQLLKCQLAALQERVDELKTRGKDVGERINIALLAQLDSNIALNLK